MANIFVKVVSGILSYAEAYKAKISDGYLKLKTTDAKKTVKKQPDQKMTCFVMDTTEFKSDGRVIINNTSKENYSIAIIKDTIFIDTSLGIGSTCSGKNRKLKQNSTAKTTAEIKFAHKLIDACSIWPVSGRLTSRFGYRPDPDDENEVEFHDGIDIAGPVGTELLATCKEGTVTNVGTNKDAPSGYFVAIDCDCGISILYAHLQEPSQLKRGDPVHAGDVVGKRGNTGHSRGSHLHYSVKIRVKIGQESYVKPVDPEAYLPDENLTTAATVALE